MLLAMSHCDKVFICSTFFVVDLTNYIGWSLTIQNIIQKISIYPSIVKATF